MTALPVLAVDIGGTKITAAIVADDGAILARSTVATPALVGGDAVLDAVAEAASAAAAAAATSAVAAVGVAATGVIDPVRGVVVGSTDTFAGWIGTPIADGVRDRLVDAGMLAPASVVVVRNDVEAHALGEARLGAAVGAHSVLVAGIGTGVGGAVIHNDQPLRGARGVAGELGHLPVPGADHLRCACGRTGHLEAIASGTGLHAHYLSLGGDLAASDARVVVGRARSGDAIAERAVRESAQTLGRALAGLGAVVDPDVIVVVGGLTEDAHWWRAVVDGFAAERIPSLAELPLRAGALGADAALVGIADEARRAARIASPRVVSDARTGHAIIERLAGGLIVSCQAYPGEPMRRPETMAQVARSVVEAGAVAVRLEGVDDIRAAADLTVPIIGIWKDGPGPVVITPTVDQAIAVLDAGADIVAIDGTRRPRADGHTLASAIHAIRTARPHAVIMADCGSLDDALAAEAAGAELIGTTLSGYTGERPATPGPDIALIREIAAACATPIVAEGRIATPQEAAAALGAGAFTVCVGSAITHPARITASFRAAIEREAL